MKSLFSLRVTILCLYLFLNTFHSYGQSINTANFSVFKSCENDDKPIHCSNLKLDRFIAKTVKRVNEAIPYYFEDSISISFTVKKGGKRIDINHKSAIFSTEALRLCHLELLNLFPQISESAYGTNIIIDFIFKIPKEIKEYPNLEDAKAIPIVKNCADFNKKGQRACFSYLVNPVNNWLTRNSKHGFSQMNLFLKNGKLIAIQPLTICVNPSSNDSIYTAVTKILNHYVGESELEQSGLLQINFERDSSPSRTTSLAYQKKKLKKLKKQTDKKWFMLELINYVDRKHRSNKAKRKKLFLKQLKKANLLNEKKIPLGNGSYFNVDSLKNQVVDKEDKISYINDPSFKSPVYPGCNSNDNKKALHQCFQQKILSHVASNFKYPEELRLMGIQGKTYVNFLIKTDGSVSSIDIAISVDELFDFESIRIISEIPNCDQPAMKDGQPIEMPLTLPISAALK